MACASVDMDIHGAEETGGVDCKEAPSIWYYRPVEVISERKGPMDDLLQKQPMTFGVMTGLASFGLGVLFAVVLEMEYSLMTVFRASYLSGILFIFAGSISILLVKHPQLLQLSLTVNCVCIIIATIAISVIIVDLADWNGSPNEAFLLELLELCMLAFKVTLSGILCFFLKKEKSKMSSVSVMVLNAACTEK